MKEIIKNRVEELLEKEYYCSSKELNADDIVYSINTTATKPYIKIMVIFVSNTISGERSRRADRPTSDARFRTKAYDWRSHLQRRFWSWRWNLNILVFISSMKFRLSASCVCSVSNRQRSLGERRLREGAGNGRSRWMHRRTWRGERKEDWKAWHARLRRGWGSYYF